MRQEKIFKQDVNSLLISDAEFLVYGNMDAAKAR